jgi:hypothetical protein
LFLHASDFYISLSSEIIIGFWNDNNVLYTSSAVDHELQSHLGQTKDYKIGICYFSAKHAASRSKNKDWLGNGDNESKWSDLSTRRLLFHWASTIKFQLSMLVYCKADFIIISSKSNLFWTWYNWIIVHLVLNNNITHLIFYHFYKKTWQLYNEFFKNIYAQFNIFPLISLSDIVIFI